VGNLTDAKPVLAWGMVFLLIGAFCAIVVTYCNINCWTIEILVVKVRIPYFLSIAMLAKITSKNQLTLPKSVTQAVGATEYFDVEARAGQIILTPVRIQRGDAVRAKLAELDLTDDDMAAAVAWARDNKSKA